MTTSIEPDFLPPIGAASTSTARITVDGVSLPLPEFGAAARAVGAALTRGGARRVAVLAAPTMATALAVTGGILAGVTVVPVPKDAGVAELTHILGDSGADHVLGPPIAGDGHDLPTIPVDLEARHEDDLPVPPDSTPAMVLYTSGTTGLPKGVVHTVRSLAAGLDALSDAWSWSANDTLAHGLPLFHVHGLIAGVLGPLRIGSSLHHVGRPTPERYAGAGGTLYFGVPTIWHRIAADETSARALAGARLLVSGSAPLPVPVFERMADLTGHAMVERYGMTETLLTVGARADGERRPGHVGWPFAGVQTRLVDEHGAPVAHDGESLGRLQVRGATLFEGYLGLPEVTAASYDGPWFVTGDIATIGPDGNHRIVGRESVDLIKSGGYRIGAGEIEAVLLGLPGIAEAAVVGVPDDDLGQRIVAHVVPTAGAELDEERIIDAVSRALSVHKRPREVVVRDSLPRNDMGKVVKPRL